MQNQPDIQAEATKRATELIASLNVVLPRASHEVVNVFHRALQTLEEANGDESERQKLIYDVRLWFTNPSTALGQRLEGKTVLLEDRFGGIANEPELLPQDALPHFIYRHQFFQNPFIQARYADFLATRTAKSDPATARQWVRQAVTAYLKAVPTLAASSEIGHQIQAVDSLDSAGHLALCRAAELIEDVVREVRSYLSLAASQIQQVEGEEVRAGRWAVEAGWILLNLREKAPQAVTDVDVKWWEEQAVALARRNAPLGEAFLEQSFWSQSAEAARLRGDSRIRFSYLQEFAISKIREARARTLGAGASFLAAASLMEEAVDYLDRLRSHDVLSPQERADILKQINELKLEIRRFYKEGEKEMGVISTPLDIPQEQIEASVAVFLEPSTLQECLQRLGSSLLPNIPEATKWADSRTGDDSIMSLFGTSFMADGMNIGSYSSAQEKRQVEFNRALDFQISLHSGLQLPRIFRRLRAEKSLSAQTFLEHLDTSAYLEEQNRPLIEKGLERYFADDFASALHLLVPQLEALIRQLFERAGLPPTRLADRESNGWQFETFGALLHRAHRELPGFLPDELRLYVERTLCEKTGWNLRNRIAHGMLSIRECNRMTTETVLHLYLSFALFNEVSGLEETYESSANLD